MLASRHDEVPSDFAPLITAAHKVLARHPTQATERSMRDMAAAASKLVTPLAELRNAFGAATAELSSPRRCSNTPCLRPTPP